MRLAQKCKVDFLKAERLVAIVEGGLIDWKAFHFKDSGKDFSRFSLFGRSPPLGLHEWGEGADEVVEYGVPWLRHLRSQPEKWFVAWREF